MKNRIDTILASIFGYLLASGLWAKYENDEVKFWVVAEMLGYHMIFIAFWLLTLLFALLIGRYTK